MLWTPPVDLSAREERICSRLTKQRRFFPFLRRMRHRLFDSDFQARLASMYRDTPRGNPPHPPAFLATVVLLQAYTRSSDFDAVSNAWHDTRWQMVLDCFDSETAPFGEATLVDFRARLVRTNMAAELLRRTVELARETKGFGYKQVAGLRVAIDSVPLDGAGKVEDTINLLGRALRLLLLALAAFVRLRPEDVAAEAHLPVLVAPSIKAGLDLDWHAPDATHTALNILVEHLERMTAWTEKQRDRGIRPLAVEAAQEQVDRILAQDTELEDLRGHRRIRVGVAPDRQISISDPEMRHGRKSASERVDGYKEYLARDLDHGLTLAACVLPANVPEARGADTLRAQVAVHGEVTQLAIDRAFLPSEWTTELLAQPNTEVICRSLHPATTGYFVKTDFVIDVAAGTVRCPVGKLAVIQSNLARFEITDCGACPSRAQCQPAKAKQGRTIAIHPNEAFHQAQRAAEKTPEGRAQLRKRVAVEHSLAHQRGRYGRFARYRGVAKNDFDAQRIAAVDNLHTIDRKVRNAPREVLAEAA